MLARIVEVDFLVALTLIFLGIFLRANEAYDHELNIHVRRTIWLLVILAFCDTMDVILGAEPAPVFMRNIFVGLGFITRPFLLMSGAMLFKQYQFSREERIRLIVPCLVNTVIILSAFFHPYVFTIDEANVLHRHVLGYAPHVLALYYLYISVRQAMLQKQRGFEDEATIIFVSLAGIVTAVAVEIIFSLRGALCGAVGLTLSFFYLYRHMDNSRRDILTGAFTRACFFADLAKMHPEQITAFCEFDMNNLKEINDKQGHDAGDKAIVAMCTIIQNCLPVQSHLYRFGGDEFAVLFYDVNMSTVYSTVYRIREEFAKSEYGCAVGAAEWKEGLTFREVYNIADAEMYEDKKQKKAKAGIRQGRGE